ncbi:MAG: hypothetical protein FWF80_01995 [Defluviitaleaceae bacterium]|nr:hypothetical protein [Defluviitaleaceae bacterium]
MAVINTPFAARVRYVIGPEGRAETVQTLSRINPTLQPSELLPLRQALNFIRPIESPASRGYFTVQEELTEE